jgi:hypothetical protein
MNSGRSVWGGHAASSSSAVARAASPVAVKLHDVMDEELAAKLQREEQAQWQREVEGRFGGEDRQTGWCFVEVPAGNSSGVMSVIQQEVTVHDEDDDEDPDYTFALELQAQEAEEYDRMRRQEASSMERVRVVRQEDPKREEIRHTLQRYYDREAHREFDPADVHTVRHGVDPLVEQSGAVATAAKPTALSGERPRLRDQHDIYLDGDGWRVPKKQFNALNSALKHSDRKSRHHRSKTSSSSSGNAPSNRI